jgi:hypothetical protein
MLRRGLVVCLLAAGVASAGDDVPVIEVAIGKTVEREVGFAIGYQCDDLSMIDVEMKAKTAETNAFVVTGKQLGKTRCRVGTDPNRPSILFEIRVIEKPPAPPARPPAKPR